MFFRLFLLFTLVPALELGILIYFGSYIGALNTIMIVVATAVIGAYMVRLEGLGIMFRMQQSMQEGVFPAEEMIDGAMILVAGALLLTPGFVTDLLGFSFVIPASRRQLKIWLRRYLQKRVNTIDIDYR